MSKKSRKNKGPEILEPQNEADLYKIKTDAVDRLVNASKDTSPKVTEEEIEKYRGKKKFRIPNLVKVLFIKWWFPGAICFFFYMGLGSVIGDQLDLIFVFGFALGVLTDLLTNNVLRFVEPTDKANDKYILVSIRKFWSIFLNIPYAFFLLWLTLILYAPVTSLVSMIAEKSGKVIEFGVGPILFGLFYLVFDMLCILIKNTFKKIIDDAKAQSRR